MKTPRARSRIIAAVVSMLGLVISAGAALSSQQPPLPGMAWIPGGQFTMGSASDLARADEQPPHRVRLGGFWMDVAEVTNQRFREFVAATRYVTTAERPPPARGPHRPAAEGQPATAAGAAGARLPRVRLADSGPRGRLGLGPRRELAAADRTAQQSRGDGPPPRRPRVLVRRRGLLRMGGQAAAHRGRVGVRGARRPRGAAVRVGRRGARQGRRARQHLAGHVPPRNTGVDGFAPRARCGRSRRTATGCTTWPATRGSGCSDWYGPDTYAGVRPRRRRDPEGPERKPGSCEPTGQARHRGGSFLCHESYCTGVSS